MTTEDVISLGWTYEEEEEEGGYSVFTTDESEDVCNAAIKELQWRNL